MGYGLASTGAFKVQNTTEGPNILTSVATSPWLPWSLLGGAVAVLIGALILGRRPKKVEDPARIEEFLKTVRELDWTPQSADRSLGTLANALMKMVQAEIEYYYITRAGRRRTSKVFRMLAFGLGTAGLLCPLVEPAALALSGLARVGYVLLALAAACLAGNELFGGTRGHIRSVATQYKLEALLSAFVLDWSQWQHAHAKEPQEPGAEVAFAALKRLSSGVYEAIEGETKEWALAIVTAEAAYGAGLKQPRQPRN